METPRRPLERAQQLYFEAHAETADQPGNVSDMEKYGDEDYVVLRNSDRVLAVYSVGIGDEYAAELEEVEPEQWPEGVDQW